MAADAVAWFARSAPRAAGPYNRGAAGARIETPRHRHRTRYLTVDVDSPPIGVQGNSRVPCATGTMARASFIEWVGSVGGEPGGRLDLRVRRRAGEAIPPRARWTSSLTLLDQVEDKEPAKLAVGPQSTLSNGYRLF